MHGLLQKILQKRGIKDIRDLTKEERDTFDRWQSILSEGEITVEKIKLFCQQQIKIIENQYTNPDNSEKKDNYLKACLAVYSALLGIIETPQQVERQALIKYLQQLIQ